MKNGYIMILVTCPSGASGKAIVDLLLKNRLISCANMISGVESRFWWKGRIDHAKETLILLKARAKKFKEIEKQIKNIHDYKVPEIVAIPITAGSKEYLDWIDSIA